jgi:hypothetical protein
VVVGPSVEVGATSQKLGVHEITTEATCTKCATYKEQAAEFFEEAVLLTQMQQSALRNKLFKNTCSQMVSVKTPKFKLQMPELVLFGKVLQATYSRPVNTL